MSITSVNQKVPPIILWLPSSAPLCTDPFVRLFVCEYVFFFVFLLSDPRLPLRESQWGVLLFYYSVENSIQISNIFPYSNNEKQWEREARGTRRHQSLMMRTGANDDDDVECWIITRDNKRDVPTIPIMTELLDSTRACTRQI